MVNKRIIKVEMDERGSEFQGPEDPTAAGAENSGAAGLPEMVPVSVRSDLPEFESVPIERVLVGLDLTWIEFLALFKIELDPSQYVVKGSGGRQASLTDNVGEYVNTIKRRMKVYPVTIESIDAGPSTVTSTGTSTGTSAGTTAVASGSPSPSKRGSLPNVSSKATPLPAPSSAPPAPPVAVRTVTKRKIQPPKWNQANGQVLNGPPPKVHIIDKSEASSSKSLLPPSENQKAKSDSVLLPPPPSPNVVQKAGTNQAKKVAHIVAGPSNSKPKSKEPIVNAVSPVTNSKVIPPPTAKVGKSVNGKNDEDSESSDEDKDPEKPGQVFDDFEIKPSVIQFLITKISNKNMLRIREELLQLKAQDDYFQLTSVAPLAAGLLEQMLCRNQNQCP